MTDDVPRVRICCLHRLGENLPNYELISLEDPMQVTFGRALTNNIVLDEAPSISRFHAVLRKENENWTVTDLKSCNGVLVNGQLIAPSVPYVLQDKDRLEFGKDSCSDELAAYRFQFLKAAKVKVRPELDGLSGTKSCSSGKSGFPPVKKSRANRGSVAASPSLVRQKLAEQERLLREELEQEKLQMQQSVEQMQNVLHEREAEKENILQELLDYRQKMEAELLHHKEHESKLSQEKEEALIKIKESETQAEDRIMELERLLTNNLHKSKEDVEQLRIEKEQIEAVLKKEKDNSEEEIQKKAQILEKLAKDKEDALEKLKQELDRKQQKEVDMAASVEQLRKERENMEKLLEEQKGKLEEEVQLCTLRMQEKLDQELEEQETMLRDELENQIGQLIMQKHSIEINLKSEMKKAIEDKDKHLEVELLQKQKELADAIAVKEEEQQALKAEIEKHKETGAKEGQQVKEQFENLMEEELVCAICNELFIKARSLGCSHTFCEFCIKSWMLKKAECPICRAPIQTCVKSIVMDNYIDKVTAYLGEDLKENRKKLVAERKVEQEEFDKAEAAKVAPKQTFATVAAVRAPVRPPVQQPQQQTVNRGRNVFAVNNNANRNVSANQWAHMPTHQQQGRQNPNHTQNAAGRHVRQAHGYYQQSWQY